MADFPTREMDQLAAGYDGRMGFYVEDLHSGQVHQYCAAERFPTASVCKVCVMVELFRQVAAGARSLDERQRLAGPISRHGTGALKWAVDHPELSLRDYCRLMVSISDNVATDVLIDLLGLKAINGTMQELGYANLHTGANMTRFHYAMAGMADAPGSPENDRRMMERTKAEGVDHGSASFADDPANNLAAPGEMGELLGRLCRGEIASEEASAGMIEMLKLCADRRMIPRYLAPGVETAHKIGSSGWIKADVGIVFLPKGPLVVSAFALAGCDGVDGAEAIAQLNRLAVETLSPESLKED
ncbi:MAG: serine hydrolase [Candidatus Latescibacterota bacterium]|nr:serine hydrolase [Candidatus Latescibacterota bacterium]